VKLANILVSDIGTGLPLLKLTDFGGAIFEGSYTDEEKEATRKKVALRKAYYEEEDRKEEEEARKEGKVIPPKPQPQPPCIYCDNDGSKYAEILTMLSYHLNPQPAQEAAATNPLYGIAVPSPIHSGYEMAGDEELNEPYDDMDTTADEIALDEYINDDPDNNPYRTSESPLANRSSTDHQQQADPDVIMGDGDAVGRPSTTGDNDCMEVDRGSDLESYREASSLRHPDRRRNAIIPTSLTDRHCCHYPPDANIIGEPTPLDKSEDTVEPEPDDHPPTRYTLDSKGQLVSAENEFVGVRPPEFPDVLPAGDIFALGVTAADLCTLAPQRLCPCRLNQLSWLPAWRSAFPEDHWSRAPWMGVYSRELCMMLAWMTCEDPMVRPTASQLLHFAEQGLWGSRNFPSTGHEQRARIDAVLDSAQRKATKAEY
jgi:hypothetical protein